MTEKPPTTPRGAVEQWDEWRARRREQWGTLRRLELPIGDVSDIEVDLGDHPIVTIRDYLAAVLRDVWNDDNASGKRVGGSSDWRWRVLKALVRSGQLRGRIDVVDEYEELNEVDDESGYLMVDRMIATLAVGTRLIFTAPSTAYRCGCIVPDRVQRPHGDEDSAAWHEQRRAQVDATFPPLSAPRGGITYPPRTPADAVAEYDVSVHRDGTIEHRAGRAFDTTAEDGTIEHRTATGHVAAYTPPPRYRTEGVDAGGSKYVHICRFNECHSFDDPRHDDDGTVIAVTESEPTP